MTLPDTFKDVSANFGFAAIAVISFCKKSLKHTNNNHQVHMASTLLNTDAIYTLGDVKPNFCNN